MQARCFDALGGLDPRGGEGEVFGAAVVGAGDAVEVTGFFHLVAEAGDVALVDAQLGGELFLGLGLVGGVPFEEDHQGVGVGRGQREAAGGLVGDEEAEASDEALDVVAEGFGVVCVHGWEVIWV